MKNGKAKVVIYIRQSSGDEKKSASVEVQLAECRKLAKAKDWQIAGEFTDFNTSGSTYWQGKEIAGEADRAWKKYLLINAHARRRPYRQHFGEAMEALKGATYLLVYDWTRAIRPVKQTHLANEFKEDLKDCGATLWTVQSSEIDYDDERTEISTSVQEIVEAQIKEKLRKRSMAGLKKMKDDGYSKALHVYGYTYSKITKKASIVDAEAGVLQKIYADYLQNSLRKVCQDVVGQGLRGKKGGHLCHIDIARMLKNPLYIGMQYDSSRVLIESKIYPPIIEKSVWVAVQEKFKKQKHHEIKNTKIFHVLTGLVWCGTCKTHMEVGKSRMGYSSLQCKKSLSLPLKQRQYGCRKSFVAEHVKYRMSGSELANNGLIDCLYPLSVIGFVKVRDEIRAVASNVDNRLALQNENERLTLKEKMLNEKWINESISNDSHDEGSKTIKTRKDAIKAELSILGMADSSKRGLISFELTNKIESISLSEQELSDLLHEAVTRVDVFPEKIKITLIDDKSFELERIHYRCARVCPSWTQGMERPKPGQKGIYERKAIYYHYKSSYIGDKTEKVIYETPELVISTIGHN